MRKFFALVFLFAAIPALSFSQVRMGEYWVMPLKEANLANFDFDLANSDLAGEVVGCIKSESGKPIVGAVVVIHNGWFFVDAASNKKGEYKARPMFGEYVVEVSMPGYEKYVGEVYVSKGKTSTLDVTLKPVESNAKLSKKGNKSISKNSYVLFTINGKHPAYEGKSFYDVLVNLPLFDFSNGGLKVAGSDNVTMHFNSRMNRAQPQMLVNMLRSIPVENVQSVKVSSYGGKGENSIMVYLHYKE